MSDPQIYGQCFAYLNGTLLSEATSVKVAVDPVNEEEVFDLHRGWVGSTKAPVMATINLSFAMPQDGLAMTELDNPVRLFDKTNDRLQIFMANGTSSFRFQGHFKSMGFGSGVNQSGNFEAVFRGKQL